MILLICSKCTLLSNVAIWMGIIANIYWILPGYQACATHFMGITAFVLFSSTEDRPLHHHPLNQPVSLKITMCLQYRQKRKHLILRNIWWTVRIRIHWAQSCVTNNTELLKASKSIINSGNIIKDINNWISMTFRSFHSSFLITSI